MSAKYKSPSFLLPNELNTNTNPLNTDGDPATGTGVNSLYSMDFDSASVLFDQTTYSGAFSMSFWVNPVEFTTNNRAFLISDNSNVNFIWLYANNDIRLKINGSQYIFSESGGNNIVPSTWQNITITRDNSNNVNCFRNGSSFGSSSTLSGGFVVNRFAQAYGGSWNYLGKIDEVSIFNKALNTTEISALYGGTSPNIYPSNLMATNLNPVAYYPLGEQAQMQGYLGNEASSEWQFPNGVLQDYVMDFNGGDNINSEANISSVNSFTASIWINRDDSATQYIYGQWVDGTTASQSWVIQTVGGIVYFNIRDASLATKSAISTTSLTTGIWYNIIAVWTGSNIKLYINNSLEDTTACTSMNNPSTAVKLAIGSSSNNVSPFNGKISNAVIWNSDQESNRDNIYNNGSPQTSYTVTPQNWWKLNADSVYTPSVPNYTTALDFGGTDYIDCGVISAVENVSSFSMSVWVYPTNGASKSIIGNWGNPYVGVQISTSSSQVDLFVDDSTTGSGYGSTSIGLSNNNWGHLVLVFDGSGSGNSGRLKGYINGVEQALSYTGTIPATTAAPNRAFRIGDQHIGNGLIGNISNAAIFDSALTSTQVSTLFNFGTPETAISFNPVNWWKLDNTTTGIQDSGSASNNGTNNGATQATTSVAVVPSWKIPTALPIPTINYTTALDFPGSSDYIDYGNPSSLNIDENITVSAWFKNNGTAGQQIISKGVYTGEIGSGFPYEIQVRSNGGIAWQYYGTNTQGSTSGRRVYILSPTSGASAVDYRDNTWHHVVGTKNGVNSKLYIDGVLITDLSAGGTERDYMVTNTSPVRIGANSSGTGEFIGEISNVAIWDSALTDGGVSVGSVAGGQIAGLYNSGQPETSISNSPLSWWKLDNTTTGIQDLGSASNNGTIVGQITKATSDVTSPSFNIPVNGVSTTLPSTALQQSDLQFDSPYSNYSLSFDGTGDTVAISNLQSSFTNLSISFWIKSGVDATNAYVFARSTSQFLIFQNSTNASLKYRVKTDAGTINYDVIGGNILDNNWHHCVMVVDTSNNFIKVYEDGSEIATTTTVGNIETSTSIAYLGSANSGAPFKSGYFDELSMFDSVLTSAQVLEIYNNGRPNDLATFSGTAPISWWRLGENAYFDNNSFVVPNSITGAPNGTGSGTITTMISADAPGTYANGIGTDLDILDRVGDAPLSTANSQSYNMIPDDKVPYVPGYVGNQIANNFSMNFDSASNTYFNAGNSITQLYNGAFTISYWVKQSNLTGNQHHIMIPYNQAGWSNPYSRLMTRVASSGSLEFRLDTFQNLLSTGAGAITSGKWYHICCTFDGTTNANGMKIYIDAGSPVTKTSPVSSITSTTNDLFLGTRYSGGANEGLNGQIDEVAIFDKALTADQIKFDLYQPSLPAGSNKTADIANNTNLPTPVAWYRMGD